MVSIFDNAMTSDGIRLLCLSTVEVVENPGENVFGHGVLRRFSGWPDWISATWPKSRSPIAESTHHHRRAGYAR
jgi:hypothetical protein